jgi:hypothetical protein
MSEASNNFCVTLTTGRSGTKFLHNLFRANYPEQTGILHESLHAARARPAAYHRREDSGVLADADIGAHLALLDAMRETGPVVDFGWMLGCIAPALAHRYGERLRVLVLTAHPVAVAASWANRGHYTRNRNPAWAISPHHANVRFPGYQSRWAAMSPFERGLFRWLEITTLGLEFAERHPGIPTLSMRSDQLFADPKAQGARIASLVGLAPREFSLDVPRNESLEHHVERRPIGEEWRRVYGMPEVLALAESLGFDMEEDSVARIVSRYQLQGWLPRLRHASGYWALRERLGRWRHRGLGRA